MNKCKPIPEKPTSHDLLEFYQITRTPISPGIYTYLVKHKENEKYMAWIEYKERIEEAMRRGITGATTVEAMYSPTLPREGVWFDSKGTHCLTEEQFEREYTGHWPSQAKLDEIDSVCFLKAGDNGQAG